MNYTYDEYFMNLALKEAKIALKLGEVPVGCVIVKNGEVISKAHNEKEKQHDVTAHAEILAIKKAEKKLGNWRLDGCKIYVTLEPCLMCTGAIIQSRISEICVGVLRTNKNEPTMSDFMDLLFDSGISFKKNILEKKINNEIKSFFDKLR